MVKPDVKTKGKGNAKGTDTNKGTAKKETTKTKTLSNKSPSHNQKSGFASGKGASKKSGYVLVHQCGKGVILNINDEAGMIDAMSQFAGNCSMKYFTKKKDASEYLAQLSNSKDEKVFDTDNSTTSTVIQDLNDNSKITTSPKRAHASAGDSSDDNSIVVAAKKLKKLSEGKPLSPSMLERIKRNSVVEGLHVHVFEPDITDSKRIVFTMHFGLPTTGDRQVYWCWKAQNFIDVIKLIREEEKDETHARIFESLKVVDLRDKPFGIDEPRVQKGKQGDYTIKIIAGTVKMDATGKMFTSARDELISFTKMIMKHFQSPLFQAVIENFWSSKLTNAVNNPKSGKTFYQAVSEATIHFHNGKHLDSLLRDDECIAMATKAFGSDLIGEGWSHQMKVFAFKSGKMPDDI